MRKIVEWCVGHYVRLPIYANWRICFPPYFDSGRLCSSILWSIRVVCLLLLSPHSQMILFRFWWNFVVSLLVNLDLVGGVAVSPALNILQSGMKLSYFTTHSILRSVLESKLQSLTCFQLRNQGHSYAFLCKPQAALGCKRSPIMAHCLPSNTLSTIYRMLHYRHLIIICRYPINLSNNVNVPH